GGKVRKSRQITRLTSGNRGSRCLASELEPTLLGEGEVSHQRRKLLERQESVVEPFNGNSFEKPRALPDDEHLLLGIDTEIDISPDSVEIDVITSFSNAYGAILAHFAHKMLSMNRGEPGIGIH